MLEKKRIYFSIHQQRNENFDKSKVLFVSISDICSLQGSYNKVIVKFAFLCKGRPCFLINM